MIDLLNIKGPVQDSWIRGNNEKKKAFEEFSIPGSKGFVESVTMDNMVIYRH